MRKGLLLGGCAE